MKLYFWPAVSLLLLFTGCSSVPPIQTQNLQELEINGLTLSVYPLTTKAEVKHVFKVNLLDRDVVPIKFKAENRNPTNSFIVAKEKVTLMTETAQMTNSAGDVARGLATWSRGKQLGVAAATQVPLIFVMTLANPMDKAFIFKPDEENLTRKEFTTRTLGPGQVAEGFIYFPFSKLAGSTNACHLVSDVRSLSPATNLPFALKLNLNHP